LLETTIDGAKGVLFGVSGRRDLKMVEVNEVAKLISENVDQSAKIIFGAYYDRKINQGQLKVTLIATGFNGGFEQRNSIFSANLFAPAEKIFFNRSGQRTNWENEGESGKKEEDSTEEFSEQGIIFDKKKKKEKEEIKKPEGEEIWDIPTFLRKKKR